MAHPTINAPEGFRLSSLAGISSSVGLFLASVVLYGVYTAIYNIFFHPLKHIPGPLLSRVSGIPYIVNARCGNVVSWLQELHEKYGDAVRIAPAEVSFTSGDTAWQDIYGFRTGKHKNTGSYLKDRSWFPPPVAGVYSIIQSTDEDHTRIRRNLSHAFSEKALRQQETLIQGYVDLLVHRMDEHVQEKKDMNIVRWYNYTTFDVISDLSFGEPLYCLRDDKYHVWVDTVLVFLKSFGFLSTRAKYPVAAFYDKMRNMFNNKIAKTMQMRKNFFEMVHDKVSTRLELETDRPDFFSFILQNQGSDAKALTRPEMDANAIVFLVAGSETTATTLSGVTYLLLKHPEKYAKLVHEIRSRFTSASDITVEAVNQLHYMIACLQEGLRCYPPVPAGFPRLVPRGGGNISGHFIPEGTAVSVSQYAAYHSERNFKDADAFVPERWMGDERYEADKRETLNPFSFGPRNCLGKNLAYAEMRLILTKVLFNFDLELLDKETDWMKGQKVFSLWEKPELMVRLHPVQR
ncbi:cytochrome P450 monooxygenase-like protein [Dothidotthia symphoricarpi CBS 119687]|uniref:Cytochrome P450 monooxygenase-like protein n=1 Tax=Dothidotthia symphoricarpi CBS 119687 TaxID=1392245 RepID=A0A6A6ATR3_9PLEO|nr:cytochrome P450 monooxygenase-like protein [Dothidotthia symphoricarpi CBS 119687]KAF2134578.1 cytochrome P450 monooxygenase-like protein [Dothidotthia symphoricarpi CBS 119687]